MPPAERLSDVTIMNYSQLLIPHMPSLVRQGVDNLTNMCDTIEYLNNIVIEVFSLIMTAIKTYLNFHSIIFLLTVYLAAIDGKLEQYYFFMKNFTRVFLL